MFLYQYSRTYVDNFYIRESEDQSANEETTVLTVQWDQMETKVLLAQQVLPENPDQPDDLDETERTESVDEQERQEDQDHMVLLVNQDPT